MDGSWRQRRKLCSMKSFNGTPIPRTRSINSLIQVRPNYISFFFFKSSLEFIRWLRSTIRPSWTRIQWESKIKLRRGSWCLVSSPFIFQVMSLYHRLEAHLPWLLICYSPSVPSQHPPSTIGTYGNHQQPLGGQGIPPEPTNTCDATEHVNGPGSVLHPTFSIRMSSSKASSVFINRSFAFQVLITWAIIPQCIREIILQPTLQFSCSVSSFVSFFIDIQADSSGG